ncbi:hypothetical protein Q5H91_03255 [Sphingomonas sp. KR1UV-12]|uniref:Uncharacterized protein n=1 Tax=Sphingomonas aurea TaxID=3063994 RepID=A0ABT9EHG5_9SPHN|nr:hypothetical protein [Sphingomonas sp. KR1UV-12]MDP1026218.1 hypothetical protein [Sphingomonas sp. KR1UV-12]
MHETPKGADPQQQDRDGQQKMDRQQNQQGGSNAATGGNGAGASGMEDGEESGAGYGNNAGKQGD